MLDYSKKVVPYIYQVREFVDGIHANNKVSLKLQHNGAYLAGQELRKIHSISVKGFGTINSEGKWTKANWSSTLKEFLDPYAQDKCATKIFTQQEIDKVYEHTIYNKELEIKKPWLIHGDIQDDHFVYNPEQNKITFIDPGSMIGGDPMFDLACSSMPWSRKVFFKGLREGYELSKPLTDYEQYRFKKLQLAYFLFASIELYRKQFDYPPFVRLTKELILKA
jgi:fructosamine-3-kinase